MPPKAYVCVHIYICTLSICIWHVRGKVACHFHLFAFWQRLVRCRVKRGIKIFNIAAFCRVRFVVKFG